MPWGDSPGDQGTDKQAQKPTHASDGGQHTHAKVLREAQGLSQNYSRRARWILNQVSCAPKMANGKVITNFDLSRVSGLWLDQD